MRSSPAMLLGNQTLGPALLILLQSPWLTIIFYTLPPFSIILHCLQKVEREEAKGILAVPNWPTLPWYTKLMQMITDYPRLLPVQQSILTHPSRKGTCHPLWQRFNLMACKLSGQPSKNRAFRERQQTLSLNPRDQEHASSYNHKRYVKGIALTINYHSYCFLCKNCSMFVLLHFYNSLTFLLYLVAHYTPVSCTW